MKKLILILLVFAVGLTAFACGKGSPESGSYSVESGSDSTNSGPPEPILPVPVSDGSPEREPSPEDAYSPAEYHYVTNKYKDKLTSFGTSLVNYIFERTGKDMDTLWKTVWGGVEQGHVASFSILEVIDELDIPKEKFIELYNKDKGYIRSIKNYETIPEYRDWILTDEDIDIMYSGDKKRIAEAFAQPYAVIADDWEIYPMRWIIETPASVYKEKHISLSVLETTAYKLIDKGEGFILNEDRDALLARIEEYRKMQ